MRKSISLFTRRKIAQLVVDQENRCAYCQEPFGGADTEARPTLDHVIPKSRGGTRDAHNLVAACARCNHAKANMDVGEFCALVDACILRPRRGAAPAEAGHLPVR